MNLGNFHPFRHLDWLENMDIPHSIWDQDFGLGIRPETLASKVMQQQFSFPLPPRPSSRCPFFYKRPWTENVRKSQGGTSTVKADKDQFQVFLDVQQFSPEEINVKVVDRSVVVEGKHEEKQDEHGFVSRQFTRRYLIPEQCDIDQVSSKLSSDGVLTIVVPRKDQPKIGGERKINIEHTGKPAIRDTQPEQEEKKVQDSET